MPEDTAIQTEPSAAKTRPFPAKVTSSITILGGSRWLALLVFFCYACPRPTPPPEKSVDTSGFTIPRSYYKSDADWQKAKEKFEQSKRGRS